MSDSCHNLNMASTFKHWQDSGLIPIFSSIMLIRNLPEGTHLISLHDPLAIACLLQLQYFLHVFAFPVGEVADDDLGCRVVQFTSRRCLPSTHHYFFNCHRAEVEVVEEVGLKGWGNLGVLTVVQVIIHRPGL